MCTLDAQGVLDQLTVAQTLIGYLAAWRKFVYEMRPTFIAMEQVVWNVGFAGRRDFVVQFPGGQAPDEIDGALLYLRAKGTYSLVPLHGMDLSHKITEATGKVLEYRDQQRLEMWGEVKP
jgi:hypothetical protein